MQTKSLLTFAHNLSTHLQVSGTAARMLERRLRRQTTLSCGQNLQMMDFAELGRPSLRAHLALPLVARALPSSRAVARVLCACHGLGLVTAYALAILAGALLAAALGQVTPG